VSAALRFFVCPSADELSVTLPDSSAARGVVLSMSSIPVVQPNNDSDFFLQRIYELIGDIIIRHGFQRCYVCPFYLALTYCSSGLVIHDPTFASFLNNFMDVMGPFGGRAAGCLLW